MTVDTLRRVRAIVSVFEVGKATGDYSAVTILSDGAGLSVGSHQSTDKADSLDAIVFSYIDRGGALGPAIRPYLDELAGDLSAKVDPKTPKSWPQWLHELIALLKQAGQDPIMQAAQDEVFDEQYMVPAQRMCTEMQLSTPLALAVVYDTCIHSGPGRVATHRKAFPESPPVRGGTEMAWVRAYVAARKKWLLSNSNPLVRATVYRMEAFEKLIAEGNWNLNTPFKVRGVTVS